MRRENLEEKDVLGKRRNRGGKDGSVRGLGVEKRAREMNGRESVEEWKKVEMVESVELVGCRVEKEGR